MRGGGVMGDLTDLPATSHLGVMERTDWLRSMIAQILNASPPTAG